MATNFGGETCDYITKISFKGLAERGRTWERSGIDGVGAKRLGQAPGTYSFLLTKLDTLTNVATWQAVIEGLQYGAVVTAEDSDGTAYTNLLVQAVGPITKSGYDDAGTGKIVGRITVVGVKTA